MRYSDSLLIQFLQQMFSKKESRFEISEGSLNLYYSKLYMRITKIMEHAKLAKLGKVQFYKMLQIYSCKCITANEVIMMGARVGSWKDCNLEWRLDGNCAFLPIFGACFSPWVAADLNKRKNNIFGHEGWLFDFIPKEACFEIV